MNTLAGLITPMSTLAERIREAMEGMSPADLSRAAKVTPGAVSQWLDGTIKSLKGETAARLEAATGYRSAWILTGEGPKRLFESVVEQQFHRQATERGIHVQRLAPSDRKSVPAWFEAISKSYVPDFLLTWSGKGVYVELKVAHLMSTTFTMPILERLVREHPDEFAVCVVDPSRAATEIDAFLDRLGFGDFEMPMFSRASEPATSYGMQPIRAWEYEDELPAGEFVMVPRLDVSLSAGHGNGTSQVEIHFNEAQPQAFRAEWIRQQHLKPRKLAAMTASGDSMEPTIHDGDSLLIDTGQVEPRDGRVYALWYDGGERVKRLFRLPGGGLRIESDNQRYRAIEIGPEYTGHVRIIGRVVHRSGTGGL
jgi:phage repressor protein C with HTH and peptisase S24 domain/transcriptional regulator with XRE-family HTH domain